MKKIGSLTKKITISIVIFIIVLSCITPSSLGYTQEEVGSAIAGYAKNVCEKYSNKIGYRQTLGDRFDGPHKGGERGHTRTDNPIWSPSNYSWDSSKYLYFDCSSFASGCIKAVTGLNIQAYDSKSFGSIVSATNGAFEYKHLNSRSELKPGDIVVHLVHPGHATVFVGETGTTTNSLLYGQTTGDVAENGSHFSSRSYGEGNWSYVRVTDSGASSLTSLNTDFSSTGTGNGSGSNAKKIEYSKFFFNGVPDGKYSLASKGTIKDMIVEAIKEIVDFLFGFMTYLFRVIIVDITSIMDRLLNNTVSSLNDSPRNLEESGVSATNADDPNSENRSVTIEGLVFDQIDLFDINIFKTN